jgi:hypothetical protein
MKDDELERIWKEALVAEIEVLYRHLSEGTEEYHSHSGLPCPG